jgi:pyrimidine operon attenuation protein / uracil phosphoribosyltransferase
MAAQILKTTDVQAKLIRLAYEIHERNFERPYVVLAGICDRGYSIAQEIGATLRQLRPGKTTTIPLAKNASAIVLDGLPIEPKLIPELTWVVVDDVLYTGRTMLHQLQLIIPFRPAQVQVAVLIDRGHREVPIAADFVGLHLATTLQEYVHVRYGDLSNSFEAYLA